MTPWVRYKQRGNSVTEDETVRLGTEVDTPVESGCRLDRDNVTYHLRGQDCSRVNPSGICCLLPAIHTTTGGTI